MKLKTTSTLFAMAFLLWACSPCQVNVTGVILDLYTHEPIGGAFVIGVGPGGMDVQTDSTGVFEFEEITGPDDCSGYTVRVQAVGYSEKTVEITNGSHTEIRLDTLF